MDHHFIRLIFFYGMRKVFASQLVLARNDGLSHHLQMLGSVGIRVPDLAALTLFLFSLLLLWIRKVVLLQVPGSVARATLALRGLQDCRL